MKIKNYGLFNDAVELLINDLIQDSAVQAAMQQSFPELTEIDDIRKKIDTIIHGPVFDKFFHDIPPLQRVASDKISSVMSAALSEHLKIEPNLFKKQLEAFSTHYLEIDKTTLAEVLNKIVVLYPLFLSLIAQLYGESFIQKYCTLEQLEKNDISKLYIFELYLYDDEFSELLDHKIQETLISNPEIIKINDLAKNIQIHWQFIVQIMTLVSPCKAKFEEKFKHITGYSLLEYKQNKISIAALIQYHRKLVTSKPLITTENPVNYNVSLHP